MRLTLSALALAAASAAAPALAQDASTPAVQGAQSIAGDLNKDNVTVGVGAVRLPDYEGSNDYRFTAAPAAIGTFKGFNFSLIGNRFDVDLIRDTSPKGYDFQLGPVVVVDFNRDSLSSIHDTRVKALGKVDTAFELGGYVGFGKRGVITSPYDKLSVSVSYRYDVSGVSDSAVVTPSINYLTPLSTKSAAAIFASAEHAGRGYEQTYFGVTPQQSLASGLPIYSPRAGWKSFTAGALYTQSITGNLLHGFKLLAGGTYSHLFDDAGNSPLVRIAGSRTQWLGAVGVAYTF